MRQLPPVSNPRSFELVACHSFTFNPSTSVRVSTPSDLVLPPGAPSDLVLPPGAPSDLVLPSDLLLPQGAPSYLVLPPGAPGFLVYVQGHFL